MTTRGYQLISIKYEERAGLRHDVRQLRNRWNQLKGMYAWYKWAQKQMGISKRDNGAIVAPDTWWARHTKVISLL